jgi:hypothetical protein
MHSQQGLFQIAETEPVIGARIIFDSSLSLLPSGMRGIGRDRHLVFTGQELDIHVKIAEVDRRKEMYGQIILHAPTEESAVIVLTHGEIRQEIEQGPFGEFSFDDVPTGDVALEILLPSRRVTANFDV